MKNVKLSIYGVVTLARADHGDTRPRDQYNVTPDSVAASQACQASISTKACQLLLARPKITAYPATANIPGTAQYPTSGLCHRSKSRLSPSHHDLEII